MWIKSEFIKSLYSSLWGNLRSKTKFYTLCVSLLLLISLIGCDNFAAGSLLKEEIRKEIEYAKAQEVDILISPELSTYGTAYPSGNKTYKITDTFTVSFKENSGYRFVKWIVRDYMTRQELTDVLKIYTPDNHETVVEVLNKVDNIQLCPVVYENLGIVTFKPDDSEIGEPKDSSIVITFSEDLSEDNDLSRIGITCGGVSVIDNYKTPVLNGNTITIPADLSNLIDVTSGKTKIVTVSVPDDYYYVKEGIEVSIGSTKNYSFKINSTTTEKAEVTCSVANSKGSVTPVGTNSYNIGEEFKIKFEQNEGYKFYYWNVLDDEGNEISEEDIEIEDKTSLETNVKIHSAVKGVTINPKSMQLLNISDWSPKMSDDGVPKDSSIVVTLNKPISEENDFSAIRITSGGYDITSYFKEPVLNENILTIVADKENLLSVGKDQTKIITVSLPSDFYYEEDGENVKMGSVTSFNYKINNTTNDKAEITISSSSGLLSVVSGTYTYNIGDVINLKYTPDNNYNFTGWNIVDGENKPVSSSVLDIDEDDSHSLTITVKSKANGISITPKTAIVPKIIDYEPKYNTNGKSYITPIKITFNTAMKAEDLSGTFNNISIKNMETDLTQYFNQPELSKDGKVLIIRPRYDDPLNELFPEGSKYDIKVSLSDSIKDSNDTIIEKGFEWIYRVNDIIEGTKPVIENLKIARTKSDLSYEFRLWDSNSNETYSYSNKKNRTNGKFWIYLEVSDEETDIAEIKISDQLVSNIEGNSITPIDGGAEQIYDFNLTGDENKKYIQLEYDIDSYIDDGLVKINIEIYDYDDNVTTTSFFVIKDTKADGFNCYIETYYPTTTHPDVYGRPVADKLEGINGTNFYKSDLENAKTKLLIHPGEEKYYGTSKLQGNILEWKLYYSQTKNVWSETDCLDVSFKGENGNYKDSTIVELPAGVIADKSKETYLKLSVTDDVGNVGDYYYNLPALPEKTFASVYGIQESTYVDNVLSCAVSYSSDYISDSAKAFYGFVVYVKDLNQEEDVFTAYSFVSNVPEYSGLYYGLTNGVDLRDTEFYIQSIYKYRSTSNGLVTNFGPVSELKIAKVADSPAAPLVIADEDVTITKNEKDTQHVTIRIPEETAENYENIYLKSYSGWSISTPTGCVAPYNPETQTIEFDMETKYFYGQSSKSHTRINQTFEIDYSNGNTAKYTYSADRPIEDNVAPTRRGSITDVSYHYSGNYIPLYMPSDDGDGMADEFDFTAYYMKWDASWDLELPDEAYVKQKFSTKTAKGYGKETYVYVPFGHLIKGTYAVFVEIPDKKGNKGFFYIGKHNRYSNQLTSQLFNYKPTGNTVSLSTWWQSFESHTDYDFSFEAYYNNEWNTHYQDGSSSHVYQKNPTDKQSASYISSYGKPYINYKNNGDEDDTFLKIYVNYRKMSRTAPFYVYSKRNKMCSNITYAKNPDTKYASAYNVPVKLADMLDCISSVEVYSNEPVLIHTLYNLENLGDDIDEWESYTPNEQELKVEIFRPTIDPAAEGYSEATDYTKNPYVYKIPRADVPAGYYYCTVVHYADGSAKMTQIHYK